MKLVFCILFVLAFSEALFSPSLTVKNLRNRRRRTVAETSLSGIFDFRPIHGFGSGKDDKVLDEQWEVQQEMLRARRDHLDKEHLRQKYKQEFQEKELQAGRDISKVLKESSKKPDSTKTSFGGK